MKDMFKYLLLKTYFKLSDRGLTERTKTDMLFKFFLKYNPEETKLIDPSLLTVFRRERLVDNDENLMDKLIRKTVELALEKGVIEVKNKIIVDATHSNAMYSHISPREELIRQAKELRKAVYNADETMPNKMPKKREASGLLEEQLEYTKELYAERYKIEAKNAELKNNYNYDQANAWGKLGITIQGATTLFLANMKRIYRLEEEKRLNNIK